MKKNKVLKKKQSKKNLAKKEIEIPIYVVDQPSTKFVYSPHKPRDNSVGKDNFVPSQKKEKKDQERSIVPQNGFSYHYEAIPNFAESKSLEFSKKVSVPKEVEEFDHLPGVSHDKDKSKKIAKFFEVETMPINKRKVIMWFSVAVLVSLIFLVWIATLKYNFSLENQDSTKSNTWSEVSQGWEEIQENWEKSFSDFSKKVDLESNAALPLSREQLEKLKEKVLETTNNQ